MNKIVNKVMVRPAEKSVHLQVATYLKLQYPKLIFRTDFAAGARMTIGQAVQHKRMQSGPGYPDLFIAEPRKGYHGLFLELKRDISEILNKDGSLKKSPHLDEQRRVIAALQQKGYLAQFACGFDHARKVIDEYLKL